jgi:hypothetical protein
MLLTTTLTVGSVMNLSAAPVIATRSCSGVSPAAAMSLMSGSEN